MKRLQHMRLPVTSVYDVDKNQENLFLCETYQSMSNELSKISFVSFFEVSKKVQFCRT